MINTIHPEKSTIEINIFLKKNWIKWNLIKKYFSKFSRMINFVFQKKIFSTIFEEIRMRIICLSRESCWLFRVVDVVRYWSYYRCFELHLHVVHNTTPPPYMFPKPQTQTYFSLQLIRTTKYERESSLFCNFSQWPTDVEVEWYACTNVKTKFVNDELAFFDEKFW